MELQKRLAAQAMKCGLKRVRFDHAKLKEIKEAITTFDIVRLIKKGYVAKVQEQGISRARAKKRTIQRRKGRQSGHGSRKGTANARQNTKETWINTVRAQRALLKRLREKNHITIKSYQELYRKVKGGFFRSTKHIKLYIQEQGMTKRT